MIILQIQVCVCAGERVKCGAYCSRERMVWSHGGLERSIVLVNHRGRSFKLLTLFHLSLWWCIWPSQEDFFCSCFFTVRSADTVIFETIDWVNDNVKVKAHVSLYSVWILLTKYMIKHVHRTLESFLYWSYMHNKWSMYFSCQKNNQQDKTVCLEKACQDIDSWQTPQTWLPTPQNKHCRASA